MDMSKGKMVSYISILLIICICSFLAAKYVIRRNINRNDVPVDTSIKLE